jgi:hypothetical protein
VLQNRGQFECPHLISGKRAGPGWTRFLHLGTWPAPNVARSVRASGYPRGLECDVAVMPGQPRSIIVHAARQQSHIPLVLRKEPFQILLVNLLGQSS